MSLHWWTDEARDEARYEPMLVYEARTFWCVYEPRKLRLVYEPRKLVCEPRYPSSIPQISQGSRYNMCLRRAPPLQAASADARWAHMAPRVCTTLKSIMSSA